MAVPELRVLGVHSLPHIEPHVEGHYDSFGPPDTPEGIALLKDKIRDVLRRTVLVEIAVTNRDERFDPEDFRQRIDEKEWGHLWGSMFDIRYLSADGNELLADDIFGLLDGATTFRVVAFIRCWDGSRPLMSS